MGKVLKRLAIVGSTDLAVQIMHFASECDYTVVGCFDDYKERGQNGGVFILGKIADIPKFFLDGGFDEIIVGVGYLHMNFRAEIFEIIKKLEIPFATMVHPSSIVDRTAIIGKGVIIYPGCVIDQRVEIKENVLLNLSCVIAHDTVVGAHSILTPAARIAGFCVVGKKCIIGIGTTIIDHISICDSVEIGAASLLLQSVTKSGLYFGSPAKYVR